MLARNPFAIRVSVLVCGFALTAGVSLSVFAQQPVPEPAASPAPAVSSSRSQSLDSIFSLDIDELARLPVNTSSVAAPVSSVVSASKYVQPIDESPCAINVLTADDIQKSGAKTLADLLRRFPGVWSWTKTRSDMDIGMLGMMSDENPRILYLLDGQPIGSPLFDGMQWPQFPITLEDVERVEIIRGGGSALYGANAYTGVINIITKPSKDRKSTVNSYTGEGGINNHTLTFARTYDRLSYYATVGWRQTHQQDAFEPAFNLGDENFYQTPVLNLKAEYQISDDQKVSWFTGYSNGEGGYPASPGDRSIDSVKNWEYFITQGRYIREISEDTEFSLKGEYYDVYQHNFKPYQAGNPEKYRVFGQRYYTEANLLTRRWERHTLLTGMAYEYILGDSVGTITNMSPGRLHTYQMFGFFVQDDFKISDRFSFISALRYDYYDDIVDQFSPRGTLMYHLDEKNTLRGSIGRSYRRPGLYAMYYDVTWPGGYFRGGGPNLPVMTALNYELEYRTQIVPNYSIKMELFLSRFAKIPTQNVTFPGPKINIAASNHEYVIKGFIWELEGAPVKDTLTWYANLTYMGGQDMTSGVTIVDIPEFMFNAGFKYFPTEKVYATLDGHYQNGFRAVADPSVTDDLTGLPPGTSVPSFITGDAKLGYHLTKHAEIGLSVENLFNDLHDEFPYGTIRGRTLYADCRIVW